MNKEVELKKPEWLWSNYWVRVNTAPPILIIRLWGLASNVFHGFIVTNKAK